VVELWPISPTLLEPVTEKTSTGQPLTWISYYRYRISASEMVRVPVSNIVHFRLGIDDRDMRKGISPLKAMARELSTDEEANRFVDALLKNYAVPGLVVIPTGGTTVSEADSEKITTKLREKFGNDSRGNIAVMSKETKIEQFGFSPEELDMSILHRVPEERISAVLGVPAIVAGLGAGLIATGHYARIRKMQTANCKLQTEDSMGMQTAWQLLKGVDAGKDQSYFLYAMTQETKDKIALFCDVEKRAVVPLRTMSSIYQVPLVLEEAGLGEA
jgi:hypothetical protein